MKKIKHLAIAYALIFNTSMTYAALVTSDHSMNSTTLDFSNFLNIVNGNTNVIEISDFVTWSSNVSMAFVGDDGYGLSDNGRWDYRQGYAALNASSGSMSFNFESPVSFAGGFMNYAPTIGNPYIAAYDNNGALLESYIITDINTPNGQDDGDFRGITRDFNDISELRLGDAYVVIDDLTYSTSEVPLPAGIYLFLSGLVGLGFMRGRNG